MRKELCKAGQDLWERYRFSYLEEDQDHLYNSYIVHLRHCSECIQRLGITKKDIDILNEILDQNGFL